jgi:hypothetical protein
MRQFAAYILITVGLFALWQAGLGTAAYVGCVKGSGFAACQEQAKAAEGTVGGLITLGLGLLYQNRNEER